MAEIFDINIQLEERKIRETLKRLMPIFEKSREILSNPEMDAQKGLLVVRIKDPFSGKIIKEERDVFMWGIENDTIHFTRMEGGKPSINLLSYPTSHIADARFENEESK